MDAMASILICINSETVSGLVLTGIAKLGIVSVVPGI